LLMMTFQKMLGTAADRLAVTSLSHPGGCA
jgi:hypothetical protein